MLVIFDCDGTLVDSEVLHYEVGSQLFHEALGVKCDPDAFGRRFAGAGDKNVIAALESETGRRVPDGFLNRMAMIKSEVFPKRLQAVPYAHESLQSLASYARCVASNGLLDIVRMSLRTAELYDFFAPNIFSAHNVGRPKPAPDLFLHAAQSMGFAPNDCVVIEDSATGVQAGLAAGMRVFGFTGGSHCYDGYAAERLQGAERVFSDMRQLPALLAACA